MSSVPTAMVVPSGEFNTMENMMLQQLFFLYCGYCFFLAQKKFNNVTMKICSLYGCYIVYYDVIVIRTCFNSKSPMLQDNPQTSRWKLGFKHPSVSYSIGLILRANRFLTIGFKARVSGFVMSTSPRSKDENGRRMNTFRHFFSLSARRLNEWLNQHHLMHGFSSSICKHIHYRFNSPAVACWLVNVRFNNVQLLVQWVWIALRSGIPTHWTRMMDISAMKLSQDLGAQDCISTQTQSHPPRLPLVFQAMADVAIYSNDMLPQC